MVGFFKCSYLFLKVWVWWTLMFVKYAGNGEKLVLGSEVEVSQLQLESESSVD